MAERRPTRAAAPARRRGERPAALCAAPGPARHAVELAHEGAPLNAIQRQPCHANLGTTSIYLQGIENAEIIGTVHARRAPMTPATTCRIAPQRAHPVGAAAGDHLGGVAENAGVRSGGRVRRGRGRFAIRIRNLTIIALQLRVPGARRPGLALTGLRPGGADARQALLLGVRNDGNVLVKGRGRLIVTDGDGHRLQDARFALDTFVSRTAIQLPVAVSGRALPKGDYRAVAQLRFGLVASRGGDQVQGLRNRHHIGLSPRQRGVSGA